MLTFCGGPGSQLWLKQAFKDVVAHFGRDLKYAGAKSVGILPTNKTTPQAFAIGVASEKVMVERRKPTTYLFGRAPKPKTPYQ